MVDKKTIISVVIVAIIVAAITALVVGSITGNAIKLDQDRNGRYIVYTTGEVYNKTQTDARISLAIKNVLDNVIADEVVEPLLELKANHTKEVFTAMNKCSLITKFINGSANPSNTFNCNNVCNSGNGICLFGQHYEYSSGTKRDQTNLNNCNVPQIYSDSMVTFASASCMCCY